MSLMGSYRFAADVGKHHLMKNLGLHAAIGKSIRDGNEGGPDLRIYGGIKLDFDMGR